jgi:hypothetical protein
MRQFGRQRILQTARTRGKIARVIDVHIRPQAFATYCAQTHRLTTTLTTTHSR